MPIIPEVLDYFDELTEIRRDIHSHPELGFTEERTGDLVARKLAEYGCEVHRGLAKTGVVGTIRRGNSLRAIGLRADMDCLPMQEMNQFAHRSQTDGQMHACGHDGHTTMLLGAARHLAKTRNFEGTVHFIFQPGEEGYGGGRVMVQEGLFEQFPCDAVFAMHNKPGIPVGNMATRRRAARRLRPLRHPGQGQGRSRRAPASWDRSVRDRCADRDGIADDPLAQYRSGRVLGDQHRLHARRLGL